MVAGFIKLPRDIAAKLRDLPDECCGVYLRLLAAVNWKAKRWKGIDIQPGQMVYAKRLLAERLYGPDESPAYNTIKKRLNELEDHGLIRVEGRPRYTLLTVLDYIGSNFDPKLDPKLDPKSDPKSDPDRRKEKKGKKESAPTLPEVVEYWRAQSLKGDPEAFFDHFESNGWRVSGRTPMKDWRAAARNWSRRQSEFSGGGNGRHEPPTEEIPVYRRAAR